MKYGGSELGREEGSDLNENLKLFCDNFFAYIDSDNEAWRAWIWRGRPRRKEGIKINILSVSMQISIKTLSGKKQNLTFEPSNTIHQIKLTLQEKEGIGVDQIKLIFGGK